MKRTQLYLEEDLWTVLHSNARNSGSTVSELVRQTLRDRFLGKLDERSQAMKAIIGIASDRPEYADAESYVRALRRGRRLARLS